MLKKVFTMKENIQSNPSKPFKVILVGDSNCGKTSLLKRYTKKMFTEDYTPTVFDSDSAEILADQNNDIKLDIWDTSGSSEFDHIRPLSFGEAATFIVCFDVGTPASLENIYKKWLPEIKTQHADKPIILVACKTDLKTEQKITTHGNGMMVLCSQGMNVAKQIGASAYYEYSSKNDQDNKKGEKLFNIVALLATRQFNKIPKDAKITATKTDKKYKCTIM